MATVLSPGARRSRALSAAAPVISRWSRGRFSFASHVLDVTEAESYRVTRASHATGPGECCGPTRFGSIFRRARKAASACESKVKELPRTGKILQETYICI